MLKHRLHEGLNTIAHFGTLKLKHMGYQDTKLCGWFLEQPGTEPDEYQVYVALTGETVHPEYRYVCTAQTQQGGGHYVLHAFD
jgi:hypothetical protein